MATVVPMVVEAVQPGRKLGKSPEILRKTVDFERGPDRLALLERGPLGPAGARWRAHATYRPARELSGSYLFNIQLELGLEEGKNK